MKRASLIIGLCASFVLGVVVQAAITQAKKPTFSLDLVKGKDPKTAAAALLETATQLAGSGSWERIAVGRAWYLGGDKAKGQQIFDEVTNGKKVEGSDWLRIARVYVEANEWAKAQAAFEKVLAKDADDDSAMIEYGAFANVLKDRAKAESLFDKAMAKNAKDFWHWVGAGGSYLGVKPLP